jgi:tellurite resistance protein
MRRKNTDLVTALIVGGLILGGTPAFSETFSPGIDGREDHQQERIYEGVQSGQVTPREFNRLQTEQARIRGAEGRMKADGHLDPAERARLNAMLDRSSGHIYRAEHNNQVAGPAGNWQGPRQNWGRQGSIDWREANQQNRIYQGLKSGQLTPQEFNRLEREQARIQAAEARMRADGRLDPRERARLNAMLNRSSRDIYRAEHNNQVAAPNSQWRQPQPSWGHRPGMAGQAHPYWRGPNAPHWRDANQQHRGSQGVRTGQLTPAGFNRPGNQPGHIRAAQAPMQAVGQFTPPQRGRLNAMVNQGSAGISRARPNFRAAR